MYFIQFLLLTLACYVQVTMGDWVNPHSMDSNAKQKLKLNTNSYEAPDLNPKYCSQVKCDSDFYLRRIIRLILNNAYLDKDDMMGHFTGHVNLQLSVKDYEFLAQFAQSDQSGIETFSEVNSIFETALQKTSFDKYKEMILTFEEELYLIIFNPTSGALACACLVLYLTYKLLKAQYTWRSIMKYLFFITYVMDFVITYLHIIHNEEIKSMVTVKKFGNVPPECDPQKLSWWNYMKTQFESIVLENPCKEFYMATHQGYKFLVAPSKVLTQQFKTIVVDTFGDIGEAFGKLGRGMFTNLPWGLNVALFPIMLITTCAVFFIVFLFIMKPRFKLSLFHFFTIELGESATDQRSRLALPIIRNQRQIREVVYNDQHRALVEDASNDNHSSDNRSFQEIQGPTGANESEDVNQKTPNSESDSIQNVGSDEGSCE